MTTRNCIDCSAVIPEDKPGFVVRCPRCYVSLKRGLLPVPVPVLGSPVRNDVERTAPHRPSPFRTTTEFAHWLLSTEARAVCAEQKALRLEQELNELRSLNDCAGLTVGRAARLLELVSHPRLDDAKGVQMVRQWLRTAKQAAERHDLKERSK